ncbi:MAG: sulfatase-like hydrolase/transferase, partial [Clostridiales bacterium]|nr:sulfatase-like hydrolase/transferase [Clostridiales bacterium]
FHTDHRFNTYITTITQHGQYAERDNLKGYYAQMDEYGILPYDEDDEDANALRYYCAAGMDTDKAIGIMLDYLEANGLADNTLITMFGDHNAYYQGISNYAKNIYFTDTVNYTELYRVPVMIKVGNRDLGNPTINKFTCVSDIYPTILDLLGVTVFSNLTYGVSAFSPTESILYSRAYDKFLTDKIYFNSLSNIIYKAPDVDDEYLEDIEKRATVLLDKISHVNRIFAADYFKGARTKEFNTLLRAVNEQPVSAKEE